MASRIQTRRDTAANWTSANPTLAVGEMGYETDTDKFKMGDGTTAWTSLTYHKDQTDSEIKTAYENNADTNEFSDAEQTKLAGIATSATANDTDANLKDRANHTGTQLSSTVSDFDTTADARITAQKAAANGLATLDAGSKIPTAQLPALAISDTFVAANQTAMLALTAETGDVAVRTDENKSYILQGTDPSILGDWQELLTPTDAVLSVNSQTGTVSLDTDDIAEGTNKYVSAAQKTKLDGIETAATADQTGAEIKTAYEAEANTNEFSDAEQTKLSGIATGATANDTDANLKARANHTGTQLSSTISDFSATTAATASVTANTAKVTNATHTGEVTGSGALTVDKTAITGKTLVTAVGTDHLLITDASDTDNLKKVLVSDMLGGGTDAAAIHDDTASEISAVIEKVTPVNADLLLIEDSAAGNVKKRVQIGNLPGNNDHVALLLNFGDRTGPGVDTSSSTYVTFGIFPYYGTTITLGKCSAKVSSGATGQVRFYNITAANIVMESTTFSNTSFSSIDLGTLTNQPSGGDIIEFQIKRATGTGGDQVDLTTVILFTTY